MKILGICLGMQLLGMSSDEVNMTKGLGFVNFEIKKLRKKNSSSSYWFQFYNSKKR